ncbi:hypothetical protein V8B97DRAFT_2002021 [Scleroderma yunnanense]
MVPHTSLRCRTFARQLNQRRLSSATRLPVPNYTLVKSSIAIIGVSSAIAAYFLLLDQSRSLPTHAEKALNPSHFSPATLVDSVQTSPDTKLLTLSLRPELIPQDSQQLAPIWSVFIKDDDIQVERPYTPLQGIDEDGHMSFWIKKYDRGEVARWLHSKQPGSSIEIRGPLKTWVWRDDDTWDDIIMVSGGTGITPFYQLLHNVFSKKTAFNGRFTLLHASKTPVDLPPSSMMDFLNSLAEQHPDKFKFRVFVDSLDGQTESKPPLDLICEHIGKSAIQDALGLQCNTPWWKWFSRSATVPSVTRDQKVLVLVCGPERMVNAIAGPYGRNYSQGKVAGILGELGLQSHQVWKL